MQDHDALIAIYNEQGEIIGTKKRIDVDKKRDILRSVNILLINPEGKIFVTQPVNPVFPGTWGCAAAGLVRYQENPEDAALRTVKKELTITIPLISLGETFFTHSPIRRFTHMFFGITDTPVRINPGDATKGTWMEQKEVERKIKKFLPPCQEIYRVWKSKTVLSNDTIL